jgi:hypothetical protein
VGDTVIGMEYDVVRMRDIEIVRRPDGTTYKRPVENFYSTPQRFVAGYTEPNEPKPTVTFSDPEPLTMTAMQQQINSIASAMGGGCGPDCPVCNMGNSSGPQQQPPQKDTDPKCEKCKRLAEAVDRENYKGGIARGMVQQIADTVGVNLGEDIEGDDRWSEPNMKRVVRAVKKQTKAHEKTKRDLAAAEERAAAFDREADNLSSALEYTTIERDYLLSMVEWHTNELTKAWERIEELERGNAA